MKKRSYTLITLIMLVGLVGLNSANAQNGGGTILQVDIPFAFNVADKTLPAGKYTVRCVNTASDQKILQLSSKTGGQSVLVHTGSVIGQTHNQATLVFNRYGDRHFFAQAWFVGDNIGMLVPRSRTEKATARKPASVRHAAGMVALNMNR